MSPDTQDLKTSGHPLADRRYAYGEMLRTAGDLAAAADLFAQTLDLAPGWIAAWVALAETRQALGKAGEAVAAYRGALRLDPRDPMGVELKLALAGLAPAPIAPPETYVRTLFDDYAPAFEQALLGRLGYCAPVAIRNAVEAAAPGRRFARALDLGCGTGLTGEALRSRAAWLEGLDLAPAMLDQARAKRVFDALHLGEALRFLAAETRGFDLVTAGDVAPYLGDLAPLAAHVAARLEPGGLFAFSVEDEQAGHPEGRSLKPSMRYGHSSGHVARSLAAAGFDLAEATPVTLRLDRGEPVAGRVVTARRPERATEIDPAVLAGAQTPRRPRA